MHALILLLLAVPPATPDAGPARKIIGDYHGTPIPEPDGPYTKDLPERNGSLAGSIVAKSQGPSSVFYKSGPATVTGVHWLTVATKLKGPAPKLKVVILVKSGRLRLFLGYLGGFYRYVDAGPGQTATLEGSGASGKDRDLDVPLQALDGRVELASILVTSN